MVSEMNNPDPKVGDAVVENHWKYGRRTGNIISYSHVQDTIYYRVLFDRQFDICIDWKADTNEEEIEDGIFNTDDDTVTFDPKGRIWTFTYEEPSPEQQLWLDRIFGVQGN